MVNGIIIGIVILMLIFFSVRERVRLRLLREKDWGSIGETRSSQISQALANLVGVAGGIYLAMLVMASFLELQLPERLELGGVSMEPLAAFSVIISLAQPFFARAANAWRRL